MNSSVVPSSLIVICVLFGSAVALAEEAEEPHTKKAISSQVLNDRYVVIGPLGIPLGQVATVEGFSAEPIGKGDKHVFRVTAVNSTRLTEPVSLRYRIWPFGDVTTLKANTAYRFRAYQDGGFEGVPDQVMRETAYPQVRSYGFVTSLVIVRFAR